MKHFILISFIFLAAACNTQKKLSESYHRNDTTSVMALHQVEQVFKTHLQSIENKVDKISEQQQLNWWENLNETVTNFKIDSTGNKVAIGGTDREVTRTGGSQNEKNTTSLSAVEKTSERSDTLLLQAQETINVLQIENSNLKQEISKKSKISVTTGIIIDILLAIILFFSIMTAIKLRSLSHKIFN